MAISSAELPGSRLGERRRRKALVGKLAGIGPAVILLGCFSGLCAVATFVLSFFRGSGVGPLSWAGLSEYKQAFTNIGLGNSIYVSLIFASIAAVGVTLYGLFLALLVDSRAPGYRFYRVIFFLPGILPAAAAGVYWDTALQPTSGFFNGILGAIGLGNQHAWLASPGEAKYALALCGLWGSSGFAFLLLLGALKQVPVEFHAAARVDGASAVRRFFTITLPLIRPVLGVVVILQFIAHFNSFALVYAATLGGPSDSTQVIPILAYNQLFSFQQIGVASCVGIVGATITLSFAAVVFRLTRSRTRQEA